MMTDAPEAQRGARESVRDDRRKGRRYGRPSRNRPDSNPASASATEEQGGSSPSRKGEIGGHRLVLKQKRTRRTRSPVSPDPAISHAQLLQLCLADTLPLLESLDVDEYHARMLRSMRIRYELGRSLSTRGGPDLAYERAAIAAYVRCLEACERRVLMSSVSAPSLPPPPPSEARREQGVHGLVEGDPRAHEWFVADIAASSG